MLKSAKGQITIVSLADGSSSMFFIRPNKSTQQIFDSSSDTYAPTYSEASPLELTPVLTVGGTPITPTAYEWTEGGRIIGTNEKLQITTNLTTEQRMITCKVKYEDPNNRTECSAEGITIISRITTAGTDVNVLLDPEGIDYVDLEHDTIKLKAVAYYGSAIKDNKNGNDAILYKWGIYNFSTNTFSGFVSSDVVSTGVIDQNSPSEYNSVLYYKRDYSKPVYQFTSASSSDYDIKITNDSFEIKADAIDVKETIKCEATVYTVQNGRIETTLGTDSDIETVRDLTDEYTAGISASSTTLTTSVPVSILTASLYQKGVEVTNKDISYDWDAYSVNSLSGNATVMWPEYKRSGSAGNYVYTLMTEGEIEEGVGYWLTGNPDNPTTVSFTGNKQVTVYREQIGNASKIECKLTW